MSLFRSDFRSMLRNVNTEIPIVVCSYENNDYYPIHGFNYDYVSNTDRQFMIGVNFSRTAETIKFKSQFDYGSHICKIKYEKEGCEVFVAKGLVFDFDRQGKFRPLVFPAIKFDDRGNSLDYTLFIDYEIFIDKKYTRILYYVKKYFIPETKRQHGSKVIMESDIGRYAFKSIKYVRRHRSLEAVQLHLETVKSWIINQNPPTLIEEFETSTPEVETEVAETQAVEVDMELSPQTRDLLGLLNEIDDDLAVRVRNEGDNTHIHISANEFADADEPVADEVNIEGSLVPPPPENIFEISDVSITPTEGSNLVMNAEFTNDDGSWTNTGASITAGTDPIDGSTDGVTIFATSGVDGTSVIEEPIRRRRGGRTPAAYGFVDDESQILNYD